jgi:protein-L-isoaspartate(D-aspartate) O-methyltransferase
MVASLERTNAIRTKSLRQAFQAVPRELFVPEVAVRDGLPAIYRPDVALATATDSRGVAISSSSAPNIMALMLETLQLRAGQRVLEVGTGTGYNAALLKSLVGESGRVTSIDIEAAFARRARRALAQGGYRCRVAVGDGRGGWSTGAPYDRIIVTASSDQVPQRWRDQLVEGGVVELPLRLTPGFLPQVIVALRREGDLLRSVAVFPGVFMALRESDGADSPLDHGPALRAWSGSGRDAAMLASLEGERLSKLSPTATRRTLALLLGNGRRLRSFSLDSIHGLIMFLNLSDIPGTVRVSAEGRHGLAILDPQGTSIATVTWAAGGAGRMEAWGDERAERLLSRHVQRWERVGSPTLQDFQFTVSYAREAAGRHWKALRGDGSVIAIDRAT